MVLKENYTILALIATLFTWILTIVGSATVFFFKKINKNIMDASIGIAAGIMLSASFWSLLKPSIDNAKVLNQKAWLVISAGILLGGLLIYITDKIFEKKIGKKSKKKKIYLMLLSITIHNIPEGLAVGIAFGSIKYHIPGANLLSATMLALAIGLQNIPEGSAISLPLRREKFSRIKSFILGSLSAIVEPIFGIIGAILALYIQNLMPVLLSFAAGAMIYVIVQELIPESQTNQNKSLMAMFTLLGFILMTILDTIM